MLPDLSWNTNTLPLAQGALWLRRSLVPLSPPCWTFTTPTTSTKHQDCSLFNLLLLVRRLQSLQAITSRLKDRYYHQAVRMLTPPPHPRLPPLPPSPNHA